MVSKCSKSSDSVVSQHGTYSTDLHFLYFFFLGFWIDLCTDQFHGGQYGGFRECDGE